MKWPRFSGCAKFVRMNYLAKYAFLCISHIVDMDPRELVECGCDDDSMLEQIVESSVQTDGWCIAEYNSCTIARGCVYIAYT